MKSEAQLSHDVQLAIGALPGVRIFRMQVGTARDPSTGQVVRFGVPGMADWLVCVGVAHGWLELKSATGRLRPDQLRFQDAVLRNGGVYRVARTVEEAIALVAHLQSLALSSSAGSSAGSSAPSLPACPR